MSQHPAECHCKPMFLLRIMTWPLILYIEKISFGIKTQHVYRRKLPGFEFDIGLFFFSWMRQARYKICSMSILARLPRIAARPTTFVPSCRHYNNHRFDKFLQFVRFSPEIRNALAKKAPVVALESAVISHPDTTYGELLHKSLGVRTRRWV